MKKIFTLLLVIMAAMNASAANFQLLRGEDFSKDSSGAFVPGKYVPVSNGDSYVTGYFTKMENPAFIMYQQDSELYIKGPAGLDMTFEVEATAQVMVCCLGQCVAANPSEKVVKSGSLDPSSTDLMAGTTDIYTLRIDKAGNTMSSPLQEITVKVTAYETANPSDKVTVTVTMSTKPYEELIGSVDGIQTTNEYVNLASGNVLKYHVEQPARLEIYSIAGRLVYSRQIQGNGSLHLDLGQGVYIYRVGKLTGKMLLK